MRKLEESHGGVGVGEEEGEGWRGDENAGGLACLACKWALPAVSRPCDFVRAGGRKMLARLELGWKSSSQQMRREQLGAGAAATKMGRAPEVTHRMRRARNPDVITQDGDLGRG